MKSFDGVICSTNGPFVTSDLVYFWLTFCLNEYLYWDWVVEERFMMNSLDDFY